MLQRAVATHIMCRRGIQTSKSNTAKSSILSAANAAHSSKISSRGSTELFFSSRMQRRALTVSSLRASATSNTKTIETKPLEFYTEINVEAERRVLEADLPKYDEAVIAAARAESEDYKRKGKSPAALISRKIMYAYYAAGDYARAHLAFLDLNAKEQPTLYDFNLVFVFQSITKDFTKIHESFDLMRNYGIAPNELTLSVLFKAFGVSGSIGRALYIYQRMFQQGMIPEQSQLEDIVKSAAIAGDPTSFARFMSRLTHKGHPIKKHHLRALMLLWKTAGPSNDPYIARMKPSINDFTVAIEYALRVHNYRLAFDLVRECRDQYDMQPDAFMYETFLSALIRDNIQRTECYAWRKRFSEYARTITKRDDHFEFASFLSEVEAHIVKELCGGDAAQLKQVKVSSPVKRVVTKRTTRKMSRQLYKSYPRQRWVSPWEEEDDMLDWVPEYKKRRELEPVKKAIELSTATLRAIQEDAHARLAAQKAQNAQPGSSSQ